MTKIAIFVDVQNIFYTTRDFYQKPFNYRKFWQLIEPQGEIVTAIAYAIHRLDTQQHKFQSALKYIGFDVKLKPYIQRSDGTAKGDWDVGITIDIMEIAPTVDKVILLSGDGDFAILLDKLKSIGVITEVYSVKELTARGLMTAATRYHAIGMDLLLY
ncbi:MAG: NYN domain-containing protein [Proteobacteria bacterium]|nr:NYN domain-containing protein [Pseudomonadota bacterium]